MYLLQERFMNEAKFREAQDLKSAFEYLRLWKDMDRDAVKNGNAPDPMCIILDLSLPDSLGKETFIKIHKLYPEIPIVVMTNTNDRSLAENMVDLGAQDYILKNFTHEEEIFRRVSFAIRRHRRTVSVPPQAANSIHQLESSRAQLLNAHQSGEHRAVANRSVEVLDGLTELMKKIFLNVQEVKVAQEKSTIVIEHIINNVKKIDDEVFGGSGRRAMRSEIEILNIHHGELKADQQDLEEAIKEKEKEKSEAEKTGQITAVKFAVAKHTNNNKLWLTIIGIIGTVVMTIITAWLSIKYGIQVTK